MGKLRGRPFSKGIIPWNKGTKGIMKPNSGSFKKGRVSIISPEIRLKISLANKGRLSSLKGKKIAPIIIRSCLFCNTSMELRPCRINQKYCIGKKCRYLALSLQRKKYFGSRDKYRVLHRYIERKLGQPKECEKCHNIIESNRFIHWANKSGKYSRDLTDWIRLCSKCHAKYDKLDSYGISLNDR